jgi:acetyl esterase/lipase
MVAAEAGENAELSRGVSIEVMASIIGSWNPQSMVDGLNFMIDEVNAGATIFHPLYSEQEVERDESRATAGMFFVAGDPDKPLAVVAAGGGFNSVASIQEAFPHARALHELGFSVAILKYRIDPGLEPGGGSPDRFERAFQRTNDDMAALMALLRENAEQWDLSLDGYSVWGSSAGGMVVSAWGSDGPMGAEAHGFEPPAVIINAYTPPRLIKASPSFPPYLAVIAADDELVPVAGVDQLVDDLREEGVEVEYLRFDGGQHGFGLGVGTPAEGWLTDAVAFWKDHLGD